MYFIHNYLALVPMLLWKLSYYTTTKLGGWLGQEIRAGSRPKTHTKVKDSVLNFSLVITFHIKMIQQQCLGQKCSINTCESWCATNAWQALVKTVVILQLSCFAHTHCVHSLQTLVLKLCIKIALKSGKCLFLIVLTSGVATILYLLIYFWMNSNYHQVKFLRHTNSV